MKKSKNVFRLGLTSFFTDVSSEMIFPILPLFLVNVLGAPMALVGVIEGIAEGTASIMKTLFGWISDKVRKRKIFVAAGYSFSSVTKPFLALATVWPHVLIVRFLDRFGKGIRTSPRDALIAESVKKKKRGKYFGMHRAMDTSGAIIGVLIAFFILSKYVENYRLVFWLSFIPAVISVLIIIFFVKEAKQIKKKFHIKFNGFNRNFKFLIAASTIFSLGSLSYAFFILRAQELGVLVALIPLIYLVYNVVYAFFALPFGRLSDKIGRKNVLMIGYFVFGVMSLSFAFISDSLFAWFLFGIYGLSVAITETIGRTFISDLVQSNKRATALGVYHTFVGLAIFPANFIGGYLWSAFNSSATFIYAAVMAFIALILLIIAVKER